MPDDAADWRRALEVLANSPEGATEALLFAHGFMYETITGLIDTGLVTATADLLLAGGRPVEVMRFRITDSGRMALER
jgi:hypothetical protein